MTAPKGTPAFASQSAKESEKRDRQIFLEELEDFTKKNPDFSFSESISLDEIVGVDGVMRGLQKNGKPSVSKPDGGVFRYKEKPVAFMESKYQKTSQNAIQRSSIYNLDLKIMHLPQQLFFAALSGPGFEPQPKATSTGPQIDRLEAAGSTWLENPGDDKFREEFKCFLSRVKETIDNGSLERYIEASKVIEKEFSEAWQAAGKKYKEQQAQT